MIQQCFWKQIRNHIHAVQGQIFTPQYTTVVTSYVYYIVATPKYLTSQRPGTFTILDLTDVHT